MAPRWTGMCSAWATISPSESNTAAEQSARSLMFGEYAARRSATPISSATPASACRNTSSSTPDNSSDTEAHHQVAGLVYYRDLASIEQRGGVRLLDQCRPADLIPGGQRGPGNHSGVDGVAGDADLAGPLRSGLTLIPVAGWLGQDRLAARHHPQR